MKLAFFDTKPYDRSSFEPLAGEYGVEIHFFDTKLTPIPLPWPMGATPSASSSTTPSTPR